MRYFVFFAGFALVIAAIIPQVAEKLAPATPVPAIASASVDSPLATTTNSRMVVIPRDSRGHFQVEARVDGRRLNFMVDTGASTIALTASAAARLGIHPAPRDFTANVRTANGSVRAAPVRLNMVEVDDLVVRDVAALVIADGALSENLLGLSFLTKLRRFEYANGKLVLEQ
ncbi:MAG: TIGR02281 family clan AA aspartic protease [Pseudomonadota bacterium]|nr:TIGR02281 family clan AA aspartic protease [Pseudomonadota bacterium]